MGDGKERIRQFSHALGLWVIFPIVFPLYFAMFKYSALSISSHSHAICEPMDAKAHDIDADLTLLHHATNQVASKTVHREVPVQVHR
jgi:hypothetical protein